MTARRFLVFGGWLVASTVFLIGCSGGSTATTVKGQVLYDGKAVSDAQVLFHGEGGSSAVTDQEGKFHLDGTFGQTIKEGNYRVVVSKYVDKKGKIPEPEELEQLEAAGLVKSALPLIYADQETTPLTAEIKPGANELEPFELKKH